MNVRNIDWPSYRVANNDIAILPSYKRPLMQAWKEFFCFVESEQVEEPAAEKTATEEPKTDDAPAAEETKVL